MFHISAVLYQLDVLSEVSSDEFITSGLCAHDTRIFWNKVTVNALNLVVRRDDEREFLIPDVNI